MRFLSSAFVAINCSDSDNDAGNHNHTFSSGLSFGEEDTGLNHGWTRGNK